jgi:hypothetical protein
MSPLTSKPLVSFFAAFLIAGCTTGLAFQGEFGKTGTVHLRIVSPNGYQPRKATIKVMEVNEQIPYDRNVKGFSIERVPFGKYTVTVEAPMLHTSPVLVVVDAETKWVTLTFPYQTVVGPYVEPKPVVLSGSIQAAARYDKPAWIKLVGVYSSVTLETQASPSGEFELRGVTEGLYQLIATRDGAEPATMLVRVRGKNAPVTVVFP